MPNEKVTQFATQFRNPKDLKRQSNPNLKEMTAALDGLRAMGAEGVTGLVDLLKPDAKGGDVHVRHSQHRVRRDTRLLANVHTRTHRATRVPSRRRCHAQDGGQ